MNRHCLFTSACAAILLVAAATAHAQGTATSPVSQHEIDFASSTVYIGGPNDAVNGPAPFPIDLDATGGPWTKQIYSDQTNGYHGGGLLFRETILNAGTEPWTDWHEIDMRIGSHGAAWGTVTDLRIDGFSIGFTTSVSGSTLNIDNFSQPVLPGQVLEIDKQFDVVTDNAVGPNTLVFTIAEFPTSTIPEPSAITLAAASAFGIVVVRRKRIALRHE